MKKWIVIWSAVASVTCLSHVPSARAAEQELLPALAYKMQEGDVLEYRTQISQSMPQRPWMLPNAITIGWTETLVVAKAEDDSLTILPILSGLRMLKASINGRDPTTKVQREPPARGDPFFAGTPVQWPESGLPNNPFLNFSMRMRRNGQPVSSSMGGLPEHFAMLLPIGEWPELFFAIASQPWLQLPDGPVKVGDSWTQQLQLQPGIPFKYTLLGLKDMNGFHCAEIKYELSVPNAQMEGNVFFAIEEGFIVKETVAVKGQQIQITLESGESFEVVPEKTLISELRRRTKISSDALQLVQQGVQSPAPLKTTITPGEAALIAGQAPDFELQDLSGNPVKLSGFAGKVVFLNFCVTWVPSCAQQVSHLFQLQNMYGKQGLAVVGISLESETGRVLGLEKSFAENNPINYPMLLGNREVGQAYRLATFPTTIAIGRDGRVLRVYSGYRVKSELEADIKPILLAGGPSPHPTARPAVPSQRPEVERPELLIKIGHTGPVTSVVFSPDGKQLASGSRDTTVELRDATTGQILNILKGHSGRVNSVAFSPDSKLLVAGTNTIKLWDGVTGRLLTTLGGQSDTLTSGAFSPDGKRLASGSDDSTVKLWDATTGQLVATLKGHSGPVTAVSFSADGKRLVSGSADTTLRFWDTQTATELFALLPLDRVDWVLFTNNGRLDASPGGAKYISWKVREHIYPFEQFSSQNHVPNLWSLLWSD